MEYAAIVKLVPQLLLIAAEDQVRINGTFLVQMIKLHMILLSRHNQQAYSVRPAAAIDSPL